MIRNLLFGTLLTALLWGGCNSANRLVEAPKQKKCVHYTDDYKQKELERIREMVKGEEKLNVLYLVANDDFWKKRMKEGEQYASLTLDSWLEADGEIFLEPKLSDDNFKYKIIRDEDEFFKAIEEEEDGSIDVLYFEGHGSRGDVTFSEGATSKKEKKKETLSVKDAKNFKDRENLQKKFSDKAVAVLLSCKTLKNHKMRKTIGEEMSNLLGVPVVGSMSTATDDFYIPAVITTSLSGKVRFSYRLTKQKGKWDIVFPYACKN